MLGYTITFVLHCFTSQWAKSPNKQSVGVY